jgi:hypothetical protein
VSGIDVEGLVEGLPTGRALAPASAFPPGLTLADADAREPPDAPSGPRIDPRHAALAALLVVEQRGAGTTVLQKQARTLLSALDLLGGAWLATAPLPEVRSVAESLRFRDEILETLRPLVEGDDEGAPWFALVAESAQAEGPRWLSYDLRIIAKLAKVAAAVAPARLSEVAALRLASAACRAALACERSVTWSEGAHERTVRANVHATVEELLASVAMHVRVARGARDARDAERTLATWSRRKGPASPDVRLPASRKPLDVAIDASSASTFWEGFTDGGPGGGVFVATYGLRRLDERVVVDLRIDGAAAQRVLGIVRWIRAAASSVKPGLGIELVDASASLEQRIRTFTRRRAPLRLF